MESHPLLRHRILFLSTPISVATVNPLVAELLLLNAEAPGKQIDLYINSPGGSVLDGLALIDAMQCIEAPVSTICIGQAASMAAWILAAGSRGLRFASPHAEMSPSRPDHHGGIETIPAILGDAFILFQPQADLITTEGLRQAISPKGES